MRKSSLREMTSPSFPNENLICLGKEGKKADLEVKNKYSAG